MAFVCNAIWTVKPGEEEAILGILEEMTQASREEPGNILFQPYRSAEEPNVIRIFEVYTDAEAFAAHSSSEHFEKWVLGEAMPRLEGRRREIYETIEF